MEIFWAVIVSIILCLVIAGFITNRRQKAKSKMIAQRYLKEVPDYVREGVKYNVVLSDGTRFENVFIIGYSEFNDGILANSNFIKNSWFVIQKSDKAKVYLRPHCIRYFEEPSV